MRDNTRDDLAQAHAATGVLRDVFEKALLAVYLHGSAVSGGLRPNSDIDLLAVTDHPVTSAQRKALLSRLSQISSRHPAPAGGPRCIEVMVFLKADLSMPAYPARAEFIYGEWLRDAFEAGQTSAPVCDPENTLVLALARQQASALFRASDTPLLPHIPADDVCRAMADALPALVEGLQGDERNVLLTLARMWKFAATGEFASKDTAAAWAVDRMPEREACVLATARDVYLGNVIEDWRDRTTEVLQTVSYLRKRVSALQ